MIGPERPDISISAFANDNAARQWLLPFWGCLSAFSVECFCGELFQRNELDFYCRGSTRSGCPDQRQAIVGRETPSIIPPSAGG